MSAGMVIGLAVVFVGYAFLYKMVQLWSGRSAGLADVMFKGC